MRPIPIVQDKIKSIGHVIESCIIYYTFIEYIVMNKSDILAIYAGTFSFRINGFGGNL